MNSDQNVSRLEKLNNDKLIQNFVAQADSRYILLNTLENKENFPKYTIEDDKLNILALYYIEIGCSFAENEDFELARFPLEKGASILENVNCSQENQTRLSNYYLLISALSYYVSFQYSKSFILIKKTSTNTVISNLIVLFLQRKFVELSDEVNAIMIDTSYKDEQISMLNETEGSDRIFTIVIAKSLDGFVKYLQSGNKQILITSKANLQLIKEIAELKTEPGIWWVIRLLILIADGFSTASLWNVLSTHFDVESITVKNYIRSLIYQYPRGIYELFITQRKSLSKVLNYENKGCIVTIPTSSGKTRIAELAILDCFIKFPNCKILYIAPFRSLAFEVENSLDKILSNLGIELSHLYGGSLFSKLDEKIIEESNVIIATPEKAKAIIRGDKSIAKKIKLTIIDEGHLLGPDKRLIVNEIFYEELRFFTEQNGGRFLLLSAVLPNPNDLALWLTNSTETIYKDTWRPSDERLGILEWTGDKVNLNWMNSDTDRPSFNNSFIQCEAQPLKPRERVVKYFPANKNEAIGCTAFKLMNFGTVLIFVGQKASVFTMAKAYLQSLNRSTIDFNWKNKYDWKAFEIACIETYGDDNEWLLFAKKGILCHHGALHADVRLPLERLMRNEKPLVIISTSTLGQGVNLGVSSVIFSTLYQSGQLITPRDFWNIAGRAGRAFIDHEAKILVAHDKSDISTYKARLKNSYEHSRINEYFNKEKIDFASSGILALINELKKVTDKSNIDFDTLIQLIAENKIEEISENASGIDNILDWIDDSLLSLHDLNNSDDEVDYDWVENFFRNSLAYIQIKANQNLTKENFLSFVKARIKGIIKKVGDEKVEWKSIIKSGIPLNSDLLLEKKLDDLVSILTNFKEIDLDIDSKIKIARKIIKKIKKIPVLAENSEALASKDFKIILNSWLKAESFASIIKYDLAEELITDVFSYKLPWILNGLGKKLRHIELEEEANIIEEISMLIELGFPDLKSIKIYQAGIRSRICAHELSVLFKDELWNKSIKDYKKDIILKKEHYKSLVTEKCAEWIDLLYHMSNSKVNKLEKIPNFKLSKASEFTNELVAKKINGRQHLVSKDFSFIKDISDTKLNFSSVNNIQGVVFKYNVDLKEWQMEVENPYVDFN